jgi:hypothetical protein
MSFVEQDSYVVSSDVFEIILSLSFDDLKNLNLNFDMR